MLARRWQHPFSSAEIQTSDSVLQVRRHCTTKWCAAAEPAALPSSWARPSGSPPAAPPAPKPCRQKTPAKTSSGSETRTLLLSRATQPRRPAQEPCRQRRPPPVISSGFEQRTSVALSEIKWPRRQAQAALPPAKAQRRPAATSSGSEHGVPGALLGSWDKIIQGRRPGEEARPTEGGRWQLCVGSWWDLDHSDTHLNRAWRLAPLSSCQAVHSGRAFLSEF